MSSRSIPVRPPQFDPPLETEYRTDRTPGAVAMARAHHGLEKITTMGDGYMVAGGAPAHRSDHASAVVALAVAMQESLTDFRSDHVLDWDLRIGIHSGPVVAGVIGSDRYSYDMWGDTVNVASRIESTGTGGEIHLSAAATRIHGAWRLEELGFIELKNRDPVEASRLDVGSFQ